MANVHMLLVLHWLFPTGCSGSNNFYILCCQTESLQRAPLPKPRLGSTTLRRNCLHTGNSCTSATHATASAKLCGVNTEWLTSTWDKCALRSSEELVHTPHNLKHSTHLHCCTGCN
eukprot:365901-Chlamydomonas_euryale.AAC.9